MFEDLIRKNRELKKDCPYCSSVVVVHYRLNEHRTEYGKGTIYAYTQGSYCMKCDKKWTIDYDDKMNITKLNEGDTCYV